MEVFLNADMNSRKLFLPDHNEPHSDRKDQCSAVSTVHTNITGKLDEGCSWKPQHRTYAVKEQRKLKKSKIETTSLLPKNNMKNKAKKTVKEMKPTSDMVKEMNCIAQKFEGSLPQHVFSKIVTASDTQKHHNRLLLPAKTNGLKDKLEKILNDIDVKMHMDAKGNIELPVVVVDGYRNTYDMKFRYLNCNGAFRIIGNDYIKFVQNNELRCQDAVHVWIFHVRHGAWREVWLGLMKEELSKAPVIVVPLPMALQEMKAEGSLEAPVASTEKIQAGEEMRDSGADENSVLHGQPVASTDIEVLQAAEALIMMSTSGHSVMDRSYQLCN